MKLPVALTQTLRPAALVLVALVGLGGAAEAEARAVLGVGTRTERANQPATSPFDRTTAFLAAPAAARGTFAAEAAAERTASERNFVARGAMARGFVPLDIEGAPRPLGLLFGADAAFLAGDERDDGVGYLGLGVSVGLGLDLDGWRPSAGVSVGGLLGRLDRPADEDHSGLAALSFDPYVGLDYTTPGVPLRAHLRYSFGESAAMVFAFGASF